MLTSNISSMPEVAGDAAYLVDPYAIASLCEGLLSLAKDPALRQQLIDRGFERARLFSWDESARIVLGRMEQSQI